MAKFIHLRNHTEYSLAEGALRIKEVADVCSIKKIPAVAITDTGNLFGIMEFSKACASVGVQPIIGCEVAVDEEKLILYAKDEEGFQNLLKLVSMAYLDPVHEDHAGVTLRQVQDYNGGLLCLTASTDGRLNKLLLEGAREPAEQFAEELLGIFGDRLYIELQRHGLDNEKRVEEALIEIAYKFNVPLIATNNCFYKERKMFKAHDALLCIAEGKCVADDNRRKLNSEFYFKPEYEMIEIFSDIPEAIDNTIQFAKRCAIKAEGRAPMLPSAPTEEGRTTAEELCFQAEEGLRERLNCTEFPQDYKERIDYELGIINKMDFPGYFLIVSDFIIWAKENAIPVGPGRGSGAGSVVAWALQITDVDPLKYGLLFERFLNPERVSMPDFDIDFCQERREEVIQYVRRKYGNDKVSQIITFGKLQAKAVVRDVARVLQIPYMQADRISKMIPFNPVAPVTLSMALEMDPELRRLKRDDESIGELLDICLQLEGLNRHASTHAAGILIADRPLDELIPLYRDPRSDIPVSQYSMKDAEGAGLVKFDFLGLRTLTLIDKAVKFIEESGDKIDVLNLPLDEEKVFDMLSAGNTIGVFQLDSTLVRDAIRKMKPDCFGDIVALTSLCRPGPMENIPTYVARKHGKEKVEYPHNKLSDLLSETQGIIVYQEQVMESAQILSGYSLGKADLLRRAMGKKIKAEMDSQRKMFSEGAEENGISKKQASAIFDLIAKFAGYGFNKSHAVAYSLIAYQTAYLRCFYPVQFLAACMNLDIGDTDKLNFYKHEANRLGIKVRQPDINESEAYFIPNGKSIIYGLGAIKGVGIEAAKSMIVERDKKGDFSDVFDMCLRCDSKSINKKHMESLAKAGALDKVMKNRAQAFASAELLAKFNNAYQRDKESDQNSLFGEAVIQEISKPHLPEVEPWGSNEKLEKEFEALGFYLSDHPLSEYEEILEKLKVVKSVNLEDSVRGASTKIKTCGVVATKTLRSGKKGRFGFAKLSDAYGVYEVVMYDEDLITNSIDMLNGDEPLLIHSEAKKGDGDIRIIAESIEPLKDYVARNSDSLIQSFNLNLVTDSETGIENLSNKLLENKYKEGGFDKVKIIVHLNLQDREVEIELAGHYAVNDNLREELLQLDSVWLAS